MKMIAKTKEILLEQKAESMIEVIVAFLVLSIIMVLFAQGISFSNRAESYAIGRSRDSDSAMKELMDSIVTGSGSAVGGTVHHESLDGQANKLKLRMYTVTPSGGGDNFIYYVFDADLG